MYVIVFVFPFIWNNSKIHFVKRLEAGPLTSILHADISEALVFKDVQTAFAALFVLANRGLILKYYPKPYIKIIDTRFIKDTCWGCTCFGCDG